ncbi:MAG: hypothetical protein H6741_32105 [Alphaproteobacteria bacterium]|nr:hypothetical protein [Alphaproteobacteria bacterium]
MNALSSAAPRRLAGEHYEQRFALGAPQGCAPPAAPKRGTRIQFMPTPPSSRSTTFSFDYLAKRLRSSPS